MGVADVYTGPERRRFKRLKVDFILVYRVREPIEAIMLVGNKEINAVMLDLCEDGMAIRTNYDIPVGTNLIIRFTLINPYFIDDYRGVRKMEIIGDVVNNTLLKERDYRLGIHFTRIARADRVAITDFIRFASLC
ncbi:MAG: PilZ domain-containing protein [Candidatus Omnitrophica bacterium]|nr:PilZ domain-containing protein [Candidatus Omnitrophota bacterium]